MHDALTPEFEKMTAAKDQTKKRKEPIVYKYDEFNLIGELEDYVNSTYDQHYSQDKFQATEFIINCGHGEGFTLGNVLKYAQRYGRKEGKNRADLLKILHYALIALHVHDLEHDKS
jgi:hypothetical protein